MDHFVKAGTSLSVVFEALRLSPQYLDTVEKFFNSSEPRVPAGSGRISGQWTRLFSVLGELTTDAAKTLGRFALRLLSLELAAAAAVGGILFVPSHENAQLEGTVPSVPGLRYTWRSDDGVLHLIYEGAEGGQRTFTAHRKGDAFRDQFGRIVGVALPDGTFAIDLGAVFPEAANDDEPKLCPEPMPDRPGNEKGKDYEDYVKKFVNPDNPTPRYWTFRLPNPGTR